MCDRRLYCRLQTSLQEQISWSTFDFQRWTDAAKALWRITEDDQDNLTRIDYDTNEPWQENCIKLRSAPFPEEDLYLLISAHAPNLEKNILEDYAWWTFTGRLESENMEFVRPLLILLTLLLFAYSGIHDTALDFDFASSIERWLWKISAISIIGGFPAFILSSLLASWVQQPGQLMDDSPFQACVERCGSLLAYCFHAVSTLVLVLYGLSRVYLLVESFVSLRYVPVGVYVVIPWLQGIPHI